MNASRHPSVDQIADLDAGLLPDAEARTVSAHLDECVACRQVVSGLNEVRTLLAETAWTDEPIPADVAVAIDAALDRARRQDTGVTAEAARVTSLAEHRTAPTPTRPRRRSGRLLLGAAAAAVVFAVGGAVVTQLGLLDSQSDSTASSVADQERGGAGASSSKADHPGDSSGADDNGNPSLVPASAAPALDRENAAAYAAGLAAGAVPVARPPASCTPPGGQGREGGARPTTSLVSFAGEPAVVRLDTQNREFTVYACPGSERVLYRSTY